MKVKDRSSAKILKRVLKQLKGYKIWLVLTVFFALVSVAGNLLAPIFFGNIINLLDLTRYESVQWAKIGEKFLAIGVTVAISAVSQWLMGIINNHITYNVVKDVGKKRLLIYSVCR